MREKRLERQKAAFPELGLADAKTVFAVDRARRERGEEPTSFGRAVEDTIIEDMTRGPRDAYAQSDTSEEAAPRGGFFGPTSSLNQTAKAFEAPKDDGGNPFLAMQARESEEVFDRNRRVTADDINNGPQVFLNAGGRMLGALNTPLSGDQPGKLGTVAEELTRPTNFLGGAIRGLSFAPKAGILGRVGVETGAALAGRAASEKAPELAEKLGAGETTQQIVGGLAGLAANLGAGYAGAKAISGAPAAFKALNEPGALRAGEAAPRAELVPGAVDAFDSAQKKLRSLLNNEANIRRVGTAGREITEGRRAQAGGVLRGLEGLQEGATLGDVAEAARSGARTGALRRTFSEPLELSAEENVALASRITDLARAEKITTFDALNASVTLDKLIKEGGQRLQPAQRRLLSGIIGEDVVEQLEKRPPTQAVLFKREQREIIKERTRLDKLAEQAQQAALKAERKSSAAAVDARIKQLGGEIEGTGPIQFRAQLAETPTGPFRAPDAPESGLAGQSGGGDILERINQSVLKEEPSATTPIGFRAALKDQPTDAFRAPSAPESGLAGQTLTGDVAERVAPAVVREQVDPAAGSIQFRAELARQRTETAKAINKAEMAELEQVRAYNARMGTPDEINKIEPVKGQPRTEQILERNPNEEMLYRRAIESASQQAAESGSDPQVIGESIDLWNRMNRALLDHIKPDAGEAMTVLRAQMTGDLADSYATALVHRKHILASALRNEGLDPKAVSNITNTLMERELKLRYPKGVPDNITQILSQAKGLPYDQAIGGFDLFWQRMKNSMFGLDLSVFGQQLVGSLRYGAVPSLAGAVNRTLAVAHLPHIATEYIDSNMSRIAQYAIDGVHQGVGPSVARPEQGSLLQYFGSVGRKIDAPYIKVTDKLTDLQFRSVLGNLRNLDHEGNLVLLKLLGRDIQDPAVRALSADNANVATYFAREALKSGSRTRGRALFTSPSMTRARVQQIVQASRLLSPTAAPEQRILAAMAITSTVGTTLAVGKLLNDWIGTGEFEFVPGMPNFGKITTAGGRVIDVIPQDNVATALALSVKALKDADPKEAGEAWTKFLLGSGTIAPRVGAAAIFDTGYIPGQGWFFGDMPGGLDRAQAIASPLPALSSQIGENDATGMGLNAFGVTNYPESAFAAAQRTTGGQYSEMSKVERDAFRRANPELAERLSKESIERGGPFGRAEEIAQEFIPAFRAADEQLAQDGDWESWRSRVRDLSLQRSAARGEALRGVESSDRGVVTQYFDLMDSKKADDKFITDQEWQEIDRFRAGLSDADNKAIADALGEGDTPAIRQDRALRKELDQKQFYDIRDEVWTAIAGSDPTVAQYGSVDEFRSALRGEIVRTLSAQGIDPASATAKSVVDDVLGQIPQLKVWSDVSNDVEQAWIQANPDLAARAYAVGLIKSLRNDERSAIMQSELAR